MLSDTSNYYIEYHEGLARISTHPPLDPQLPFLTGPVNILSRVVANFNDWILYSSGRHQELHIKLQRLTNTFHALS